MELYNLECERTILGAIIVDDQAMAKVASEIDADEFYQPAHKRIFAAMQALFNRGAAIDFVTIKNEIGAEVEKAGGMSYIAGLADGVPKISNISEWCQILKSKVTFRRLKTAVDEVQELCAEGGDPDALVDTALAKVMAVANYANAGKGYHSPATTAKAAMLQVDSMRSNEIIGLRTGFFSFDRITRGLQAPRLYVVAGRPAMGKSAWSTTVAQNIANAGKVVAMVSLEMDHPEIGLRFLKGSSRVKNSSLSRPSDAESLRLTKAFNRMVTTPIYIDDDPTLTLTNIMARTRQLKAEHGLDLLIIDYLQLVRAETSRWANRQEEIAQVARGLKVMAKSLKIPVIALSQLSRKVEERTDKRPMLSDLRESGEIEQAADMVILLYRPYVYDTNADPQDAEWIIAKHRNGPLQDLRVYYTAELTLFENQLIAEAA